MHYDHKQEIHQTFEDYILLLYKHVNFVDAQANNVALVIVHMKYILPKIYNFIVGSTLKANYLISFRWGMFWCAKFALWSILRKYFHSSLARSVKSIRSCKIFIEKLSQSSSKLQKLRKFSPANLFCLWYVAAHICVIITYKQIQLFVVWYTQLSFNGVHTSTQTWVTELHDTSRRDILWNWQVYCSFLWLYQWCSLPPTTN